MEVILTIVACVMIAVFAGVLCSIFNTVIPNYLVGLVGDIILVWLGYTCHNRQVLALGIGLSVAMLVAILFEARTLASRRNIFRMP